MSNHRNTLSVLRVLKSEISSLTVSEAGALLFLLCEYPNRNGGLPADDAYLASITKQSKHTFQRDKKALESHFQIRDGSWFRNDLEQSLTQNHEETLEKPKNVDVFYEVSKSLDDHPLVKDSKSFSIISLSRNPDFFAYGGRYLNDAFHHDWEACLGAGGTPERLLSMILLEIGFPDKDDSYYESYIFGVDSYFYTLLNEKDTATNGHHKMEAVQFVYEILRWVQNGSNNFYREVPFVSCSNPRTLTASLNRLLDKIVNDYSYEKYCRSASKYSLVSTGDKDAQRYLYPSDAKCEWDPETIPF